MFNKKNSLLTTAIVIACIAPTAALSIELHAGPGDVASTELTAISVQTLTAANTARLIGMRFDPMFNQRGVPGGSGNAAILPNGFTSLSSGEETKGVSFWANGSVNRIEDDFKGTRYDGYSNSLAIGGDYQLNPNVVVGLSLSYSVTDIDTGFNSGDSKTKGVTLMPYVNLTINEWLSADLSLGYSDSETDVRRKAGATTITGTQDSEGWIAVANLTAQNWYDQMFVSATAGLLYNEDRRANFTESNGTVNVGKTNNLTQASLKASVGYWMDPFMPSLSLTYTYDLDREDQVVAGGPQPANDEDGLTVGLGVSIYGSGATAGLSGTLSLTSELLREDLTNNGIALNVRYAF